MGKTSFKGVSDGDDVVLKSEVIPKIYVLLGTIFLARRITSYATLLQGLEEQP